MFSKSSTMGGNTLWLGKQELKQALAAITAQQDVLGEFCIFIDSLDEYGGDQAAFLNWLLELTDPSIQRGLRLKFCFFSWLLKLFRKCWDTT